MTEIPAPIHSLWPVVEEWLESFGPAAAPLLADAAWSAVFTTQSFAPGAAELAELWESGGEVSWLGGPAVPSGQGWPRNADGAPLAHVAAISLADVHGAAYESDKTMWPEHRRGLPRSGFLEVFHDLTVYGWEPQDREQGGWLVRWTPEPDRSALVAPPADLDPPTDVCQPGLFLGGFTLPASLDVAGHGHEAFDVAEQACEQLWYSWQVQITGRPDARPLPVTHVYGHSQHGSGVAREVLAEVLPLTAPGDVHRLVLDLESWTHLAGWFGDAAPLELWMRQSDLDARRFESAWCLTRTD